MSDSHWLNTFSNSKQSETIKVHLKMKQKFHADKNTQDNFFSMEEKDNGQSFLPMSILTSGNYMVVFEYSVFLN